MSRGNLRAIFTSILLTLVIAPIAILPYGGDDVPNRQWATASWSDSIRAAVRLNKEWMEGQGRFFPGGTVYSIPLWHLLDSRVAYTAYIVLLNLALVGLVGFVTLKLTRSPMVAAVATIALGACMQIRWYPWDGLTNMGGLVQYTLILTILSALGAAVIVRTGNSWLAIPIAIGWSLAITAYEVSLLMLPAMLVLIIAACGWAGRRRMLLALAPLLIPAALQLLITAYLRSKIGTPNPAYTVDLGGPVGQTFFKQLSSVLPLSQYYLGGAPDTVRIPAVLAGLLIVALAVPVFLLWRPAVAAGVAVSKLTANALIIAGAWALFVPSMLAGVTQRQQSALPWGQGYIYVVYEYVGLALIVAGGVSLLANRERTRGPRLAAIVVLAVVCVACALTIAANFVYAGQFLPGPQGPG